ncbi:MAG TPA: carbohydrate binding domain-containing protein [Pyrinomonadaceae bacterium]|nr:carbohydrate binding domain-containing protein [Pyrinomonadaceae bacterium]
MREPLVILPANTLKARLIVGAVIVSVLLFVWFSVRWQLGNMIASLTSPGQPNAKQVADLSRSFAPSDPRPVWLAASTEKGNFSPDSLEKSVQLFEQVVERSPHDFRWWVELGRAYEQAEKPAQAELAFKRAVELAPTYTFPHWQFGNFYLRQNRSDEAFAELRKTTERSVVYREQVFSLAWDYFDKDPQRVEELAAEGPEIRASLAIFYAARGSADNALRIWNLLPDDQKQVHIETAEKIARALFEKQRFREALAFSMQSGIDKEAAPDAVTNGGFERFVSPTDNSLFGWRILRGDGKIDINPDSSVKTEGGRGLKLSFKGYAKPELHNVVQYVAVQPGARYRLSFMVRTENLRSGGPPLVQVVSGPENRGIGASEAFAVGSSDWTPVAFEFTVPDDFDGIHIRTSRIFCEECQILGTVWYDDFRLTKL